MNVLASDDMKGRAAFTPDIDRAAGFISGEFKKAGLSYFDGLHSYQQSFYMLTSKNYKASGSMDGQPIEAGSVMAMTPLSDIKISQDSAYQVTVIDSGDNFLRKVYPLLSAGTRQLIFVNRAHENMFKRLGKSNRPFFESQPSVVFVLCNNAPEKYDIEIQGTPDKMPLTNVVGVLPGKSKKNEFVVFSAHYDHLGVGKPDMKGDSIYNGANDDASGTTAVIELAKYFAGKKHNERTLIFVAFTAEESGGYGSRYFSKQLDPDAITAMFNIEMVGTPSQWGPGNAYITGYEKSDFGKILQKNISDSSFVFYPDPYTDQNLFYRSDNATLAALGVPAHTISTSNMHNEPYYHKQGDEVSTLDMKQLAHTISAIALASTSIVQGRDTPSRVEKAVN